jgi:putative hemolysin
MAQLGRDYDEFDAVCDHLVVLDPRRRAGDRVVGTYRLMREAVRRRLGRWYSAAEYALSPVVDRLAGQGGLLELGRSCVHPDYRGNATIQLLWRGIAAYLQRHDIGTMFGCASLAGTDPDALALPLAYLHRHHRAPEDLRVRAQPGRRVAMDRLPADMIDPRRALAALPPLIKAYLRLGAHVGEEAVIDHQFGTTDVFILLPVDRIPPKYLLRFDRD